MRKFTTLIETYGLNNFYRNLLTVITPFYVNYVRKTSRRQINEVDHNYVKTPSVMTILTFSLLYTTSMLVH